MWKKISCVCFIIMFCVLFSKQTIQAENVFPVDKMLITEKTTFEYTAEETVEIQIRTMDTNSGSPILNIYDENGYKIHQETCNLDFTNLYINVTMQKGTKFRFEFTGSGSYEYTLNCYVKEMDSKTIKNITVLNEPCLVRYKEWSSDTEWTVEDIENARLQVEWEDGNVSIEKYSEYGEWMYTENLIYKGQDAQTGDDKYYAFLYYYGKQIPFEYTMKQLSSVAVKPVDRGEDLSFSYNKGIWQGYSFVPTETGYYYYTLNSTGYTKMLMYAEGEKAPIWKENSTFANVRREFIYLTEGREYVLYGCTGHRTATAVMRLRKKTNQQRYADVEVEKLPDVSYTGEKHEPRPVVKLEGKDISTIATNIKYIYYFNKEPGIAIVTVKFEIKITDVLSNRYEVYSPFVIRQPIDEAEVTMPEYTYTGSPIIPETTVKIKGKNLKPDKDYMLEVANNTDAGTGTVKITGIGKYEGSIQKTFYIRPTEWKIEVKDTFIKNKKSKSFKLNPNSDGVLSYKSNNKKVAQVDNSGKVKVKGYGTAVITITANADNNHVEKKVSVKIIVTSKTGKIQSVKRTNGKKAIVKLQKVSDALGYEVSYSTDQNFKKSVKKVTTKKNSVTIKNLKDHTTYYVRVRTYRKVNGKKLYSDYSKIKKYSHKK